MIANDRVRLFVGCDPNWCDLESLSVLEWSIRKHASLPVDITWMMLSNDPLSPLFGWDTSRWATTFSGLRWAVPELCEFKGRAIYCDSDVIFLADIRELWEQPLPAGKAVIGKGGSAWRICVCLFDCERAHEHIPPIAEMKADSVIHGLLNQKFKHEQLGHPFIGDWNNMDARLGEKLSDIKVLHYTRMATQPQIPYALKRLEALGMKHWFDGHIATHPREDITKLFGDLLIEATENGYAVEKYMDNKPYGKITKRSFAGQVIP